jgi:ADP-dependent NAD(P)H-hydrate dehydratase / NAD(P)H-hydrate epimerase
MIDGRGTEVLTPDEMGRADRLAVQGGVPSLVLMEAAGRQVAEAIEATYGVQRTVILCGPGNNCGDGFVAARFLKERGWPVDVVLVGDRGKLRGDAAVAAARIEGCLDGPGAGVAAIAGAGLIVDGLLGSGLDRDVSGEMAEVVSAINASGALVVAIDMPTGIDGATGRVRGKAVRAHMTVTFFRKKPGHLLDPGARHRGHLLVREIGIPASVLNEIKVSVYESGPMTWRVPRRRFGGHKHDAGHCLVLSGDKWHTGAARLVARGALRVGAGLVTIGGDEGALGVHSAHVTAIMLAPMAGPKGVQAFLADSHHNVVVLGPALASNADDGARVREMVKAALGSPAAVVLDADALSAFAHEREALFGMIAARGGRPVVLTPHEGEFGRLFADARGEAPAGEGASKLARARAAARRSGAIVLLKGPDTVIAEPDGLALINMNGPPYLATAGSGDVLAGLIGGLLAQGMEGLEAAAAAAWVHGAAANLFGGPGLIAEDLPELVPDVLARLGKGGLDGVEEARVD